MADIDFDFEDSIKAKLVVARGKKGDKGDTGYPTDTQVVDAIDTYIDTNPSVVTDPVATTASTWLGQHIQEGYAVDNSLTVAGAAADAKKTGDEITDLKSQISQTTHFEPVQLKSQTKKYIKISSKTIGSGGVTEIISYPIAVSPGQVYEVHGYASQGTKAEYAFANGNTITYVYPESDVSGAHDSTHVIVIPNGVDTLYVSTFTTNGYGTLSLLVDNADTEILYDAQRFDSELFEVSTINPTTGQNENRSGRARTKGYLDNDIAKITPSSLGVLLYAYNVSNDSYVGVVQGLTVYASGVITSDPVYSTNAIDLRKIKNRSQYKFRLTIDKGNATSAEASQTLTYQRTVQAEINAVRESIENIGDEIESELYLTSDDTISRADTAADVWDLYDALVTANPDYVTKNSLTQSTFTNYEYAFDSHAYDYQSASRTKYPATAKPEILITSGMHGNEPTAVMATYGFFKALCEDRKSVSKIRQSFVFRVIPVAVPWGYTNNKRWNENGVNINRNFDADWVAPSASAEPYTNSYQGTSAASELETQVLQAWLDAHDSASLYIDYHNSGYEDEVSYLSVLSSLDGFTTIQDAFRYGINAVIGYWRNKREMTSSDLIYEYTGYINLNGNSEKYGDSVAEIPSVTLETSDNQNESGNTSRYTIGVGMEALAAFIHGLMDYHFKV